MCDCGQQFCGVCDGFLPTTEMDVADEERREFLEQEMVDAGYIEGAVMLDLIERAAE